MFLLHDPAVSLSVNKKRKRVGRGIGSGKGKTSGRGVKGQKARTGVSIVNFEGGQNPLSTRLPKRGFTSLNSKRPVAVNLDVIEDAIKSGKIDPSVSIDNNVLYEAGIIKQKGKVKVKLLSRAAMKTPFLRFKLNAYSASAKSAILEAKGDME